MGIPHYDGEIDRARGLMLSLFVAGTGSTPGAFLEDDAQGQSFTSSASPSSETSETHRNAMDLPLDQPSWTFNLLGESGESDPHLLKHSTLAIHAENMHFRRFQRGPTQIGELDCHRPIVFSLDRDNLYNNYEPRVKDSELSAIRNELARISSDVGIRLVKLYFKYIHPYFSVLSRSQMLEEGLIGERTLSLLPLSLKAALYASALPYMVYDDVLSTMADVDLPTSKELYRMCWSAITQEIHTPRLSTLQSCLLLLQCDNIDRLVQGSPFQWSLLAWTVSLAQTLGLATDCSTAWGMPDWEKRFRKWLWTRLDGNASLGLAYWAVHLLISRAILRSLEAKVGNTEGKQLREECSVSVRLNAESCCVEFKKFTDKLQAGACNAFWHKFSPSNFAIASSVMMRLLMTSVSSAEKEILNNLIDRWRWVLRSGGGNAGSAIMSLGLWRLDRTLLTSHPRDESLS